MAEFDNRPADLFDWDSATPLERGQAAHDELVASEVLQVEPMASPRPLAPPQMTRINRGLLLLPLLTLVVVLVLLLSGCSDDGDAIKAQRDQQYNQLATADAQAAVQPVATITTELLPEVIAAIPATVTPTPPETATATPGHTLNVFVTPIEAVEVTQ